MPRFASYVICTSPRSGSTLLCRLLAATGVSGNPGSHFHRPDIEAWLRSFSLERLEGESERDCLFRILEAAKAKGSLDTGMFGLRMQRGSFPFFISRLGMMFPEAASERARIESAFGPTLFIHLTRLDKVEQAVSCERARQTGLWHRARDGSDIERLEPVSAAGYDGRVLRAQYDEFIAFDRAWEAWFAAEGIVAHHITYEALSAAPAETLADLLDALGLSRDHAEGIKPDIAKLADAISREWVARFRAENAL